MENGEPQVNGLGGISRRDFMKFCVHITATLGLSQTWVPKVADALENSAKRVSIIWLHFAECTGDTESFLRSAFPSVAKIVLETISLDYHETIMAAAGNQAEEVLKKTLHDNKGKYIVVCEGAIPMATPPGPSGRKGGFLTIGNKTGYEVASEVCSDALAVLCVGTCSSYGGVQAQRPNPTGAMGVSAALGIQTINLPGCPHNAVNSVATIVNYLLLGKLPATDKYGRPLFAHGKRIHDQCSRRAHFDAGQFVTQWGSPEAQKRFCLYKMGCKGPQTYHNCNIVRWNRGTGWPIGAGHGCVGCSEPDFWDRMSPFYARLDNIEIPFSGIETSADKLGLALTGAAVAGAALHSLVTYGKKKDKNTVVEAPEKNQKEEK